MQIFAPAAYSARSGRIVAPAAYSARSASKRLTPLGWLMGPEGGFSSLYGASRRLPGAPTASWGSYGLRRLSLSGFILFGFFDVAVNRAH